MGEVTPYRRPRILIIHSPAPFTPLQDTTFTGSESYVVIIFSVQCTVRLVQPIPPTTFALSMMDLVLKLLGAPAKAIPAYGLPRTTVVGWGH